MRLKLESRKLNIIILQFFVLLINVLFLITNVDNSYRFWCICGTVDILILSCLLVRYQKAIVTPVNMFFGTFCLFQFGLPIIYGVNGNYYNFYIELFSRNTLLEAAKYSVISIVVASIAISFALIGRQSSYEIKIGKFERIFNNNKHTVAQAAYFIFIFCAVIILPMTLMAVMTQLASGIYSTANRDVMIGNALLRFVQEFFYSSALLTLCFEEKYKRKLFVKIVYAIVCINMLLLADRAFGLVGLLVLAYYNTFIEEKKGQTKNSKTKKRTWMFASVIVVLLFLMAFIAAKRKGYSTGLFVFTVLLESVLSEFGFNFTSICFVMDYVPRLDSFKYGSTYLLSILQLIPSSLDIGGFLSNTENVLGETWLYNMNNSVGREFLNFGVGFSIIGESYINFAWFGILMIFIIVFLVSKLLRIKLNSYWKNYILLIMLLDLMMLPRRQFATLLKSVEYAIIFMGLYLYVFISLRRKYGTIKKEN